MKNNVEETNNGEKTTKVCKKCGEVKLLSEFPKHKNRKDGHTSICKSCTKEHDRIHYLNNIEYHKTKATQWQLDNPEAVIMHIKKYRQSDKYETNRIAYYQENKDEMIINSQKWGENNKDKARETSRQYEANNRDLINENYRNKYQNDIQYRISKILRSRIHGLVGVGYKSQSTMKLLGCTVDEFKQYIEQQLFPEMDWDNHGIIWEIDHILPCASFDLTLLEEQQKCFHHTNMQPLFKTTDIAKSFGYDEHMGNRNKNDKIL